jgi:hypothetical protein
MWLRDLEEKEKQVEASVPAAEPSDLLPDWLSNVENDSVAPETVGNQDVSENDLSNWLSGLDDEPGLPFDAMPTPDSILFSKSQETAKPKSDLPDWLSTVDSTNAEPEDAWKKSVVQEPLDQTTGGPVPETPAENLPDWLKNVDEEESAKVTDDTAPWVHREAFEEKETSQPKPTAPSDWHPVEAKQKSVPVPVEKKVTAPLEARQPIAPQVVPPAQPPVERSVAKKKPAVPVRPRQAEGLSGLSLLQQAEAELERGDIPAALDHYKKLIKKGKHLEETIRDLTESIYRYPVEVGIWQTLGDAYMRANRLKEALEAYNKAEELIR